MKLLRVHLVRECSVDAEGYFSPRAKFLGVAIDEQLIDSSRGQLQLPAGDMQAQSGKIIAEFSVAPDTWITVSVVALLAASPLKDGDQNCDSGDIAGAVFA